MAGDTTEGICLFFTGLEPSADHAFLSQFILPLYATIPLKFIAGVYGLFAGIHTLFVASFLLCVFI